MSAGEPAKLSTVWVKMGGGPSKKGATFRSSDKCVCVCLGDELVVDISVCVCIHEKNSEDCEESKNTTKKRAGSGYGRG